MSDDQRPRRKRRRPKRSPIPREDSWGLLARDMAFAGLGWGLVAVGLLWLAELPAARHVPGVAMLPRLSGWPVFDRLPTAAHVFGVKVPPSPPPPRHHATRPTPRPAGRPAPRPTARVAVATPAPVARPTPAATATPVPAAATPATTAAPPARPVPAAAAAAGLPVRRSTGGVRYAPRVVNGVPVRVVAVDLMDPSVHLTVALANRAERPNVAGSTSGDEPFEPMARRMNAAAVINGTFFSKDAEKRVMGNMVRDGALIKFSQWDHDGTTFSLEAGNRPRLGTKGVDDEPAPWNRSWLAVTAGPRLLRAGVTWCQPTAEGFHDPHVMGEAGRSALGFDGAGKRLYLVSFDANVTLPKAAEVMRAIGCQEAMNLDGGDSRALAVGGRVVVPARRELTNVLAVYDRKFPAPRAMREAFADFRPTSLAP